MSLDAKKHTTIAAGETPSRAALAAAIFSTDDIIPVANATEANQVATAVAAAGQSLATNPVFVSRADARGLHRIEYSYDGTVWLPASGVLQFANDAARTAWTSANSALLNVGDTCVSNGVDCRWNGTAWMTQTAPGSVVPVAGAAFTLSSNALYTRPGWLLGSISFARTSGTLAHADEIMTLPVGARPVDNYNADALFTLTANPSLIDDVRVLTSGVVQIVSPPAGRTGGAVSFRIPIAL